MSSLKIYYLLLLVLKVFAKLTLQEAGILTRKWQQTIQDLIAEESFCIISKDVLSLLITENNKYFDMVVELQQKHVGHLS